jgi:GGDEF domain-containing protein
MGLLEKAYRYKQQINEQGRETLIDRIKGPAETDFINEAEIDETIPRPEEPAPEPIEPVIISDDDVILQAAENNVPDEVVPAKIIDEPEINSELASRPEDVVAEDVINDMGMENTSPRENASDEGASVSDDLFLLPEEDNASPVEVLKAQMEQVKQEADGLRRDNEKKIQENEKTGFMLGDDDPFGIGDEPIIGAEGSKPKPEVESMLRDDIGELHGIKQEDFHAREKEPPLSTEVDNERSRDSLDAMQDDLSGGEFSFSGDEGFSEKNEAKVVEKETMHSEGRKEVKRDKKFHDFIMLYEIGKEIFKSETRKEFYDVVLFTIMGQIGASSSSIMIHDPDHAGRWIIGESRGVTVRNRELYFETSDGILKQLINQKNIVDLEHYKNRPQFKDEYYKFISVDARLLAPLSCEGEVLGAVIMGDKITIGDYSDEEKDFIISMCEISAITLKKVIKTEVLIKENTGLAGWLDNIRKVDDINSRLLSCLSRRELTEMIVREFDALGVVSYGCYMYDSKEESYVLLCTDKNDVISLFDNNKRLFGDHPLVRYSGECRMTGAIEGFHKQKVIQEAFSEKQIKQMSTFMLYPHKIGSFLEGFIFITNIADNSREAEIDLKVSRLSRTIFPYVTSVLKYDTAEMLYIDNIEPVIRRVENELHRVKELNIPLTVVLFSIKNFKRYHALYGAEESKRIITNLENIIRARISDHDFSVRYDRNKILLVLPGKNKKFAVPLSNTVRNEILSTFKKKEMQLLITFLTAEYPEDADDLYSLLDNLD